VSIFSDLEMGVHVENGRRRSWTNGVATKVATTIEVSRNEPVQEIKRARLRNPLEASASGQDRIRQCGPDTSPR